MKIIFLFVSVLFSINLFSQTIEKFTYSYYSIDRNHKIGLPPKVQKNLVKDKIIIDHLKKSITIECITFNEKYDTTFRDKNLIFFRFKDQGQLILTDDKKRADYDSGDFSIAFFPLIKN